VRREISRALPEVERDGAVCAVGAECSKPIVPARMGRSTWFRRAGRRPGRARTPMLPREVTGLPHASRARRDGSVSSPSSEAIGVFKARILLSSELEPVPVVGTSAIGASLPWMLELSDNGHLSTTSHAPRMPGRADPSFASFSRARRGAELGGVRRRSHREAWRALRARPPTRWRLWFDGRVDRRENRKPMTEDARVVELEFLAMLDH
jgi:hypothetical protein